MYADIVRLPYDVQAAASEGGEKIIPRSCDVHADIDEWMLCDVHGAVKMESMPLSWSIVKMVGQANMLLAATHAEALYRQTIYFTCTSHRNIDDHVMSM